MAAALSEVLADIETRLRCELWMLRERDADLSRGLMEKIQLEELWEGDN